MRVVLTGAPGALYRPTATDIPSADLTNSFFRYLDLSGFDLSLYDLTDVDVLDCDCRNVLLPAAIDHLMSRRCDWTGATIPATVSSLNHDLVIESMKQRASQVSTTVRNAGLVVIKHMQSGGVTDYSTSWHDGFQALRDAYPSVSVATLRTRIAQMFATRPRLAARLTKEYQKARSIQVTWPSWAAVGVGGNTYDFTTDVAAANGDRWLLARSIEVTLNTLTARAWLCHVEQVEPWPFVEIIEAGGWTGVGNWWRGLSYLDS